MPQIYETADSREGLSTDSSALRFECLGYADEFAAAEALLAEIPATFGDHSFSTYELVERHRDGAYKFQANYEKVKREDLEEGEWSFSFDTTGATETVTQSFGTRAYTPAGRDPTRDSMFGNAIKVTGKGTEMKAEGVGIIVPALGFQIRASLPGSLITLDYAALLSEMTGKTNSQVFPPTSMPFVNRQFSAGQVLFRGAVGSWNSGGRVELTFSFDAGENAINLSTGSITGIAKNGHEFVWYRYKTSDDAVLKKTVLIPDIAFVEQVYRATNLNLIFSGRAPV